MAQVFISYAKEDADRARALADVIRSRGWTVWWDPHIPYGDTWADVIERELQAASCVVVMWSAASVGKRWVKKEARFGFRRQRLIPVLIDDAKIPFEFEDVQYAPLIGWTGDATSALDLVLTRLEDIAGPPAPPSRGAADRHRASGQQAIVQGDSDRGLEQLTQSLAEYEMAGDWERARHVLQSLLDLDPTDVSHHVKRVELADRSGNRAETVAAYLALASLLDGKGDDGGAKRVYERVLTLDPENREARLALDVREPSDVDEEPIEADGTTDYAIDKHEGAESTTSVTQRRSDDAESQETADVRGSTDETKRSRPEVVVFAKPASRAGPEVVETKSGNSKRMVIVGGLVAAGVTAVFFVPQMFQKSARSPGSFTGASDSEMVADYLAASGPSYSPGDAFRDCTDGCPEMVVIPAGSFLMGSPDSEDGRGGDEGPQHRVTIQPFALGRYEVTNAEFARGAGLEWQPTGADREPAARVSWNDAKAYVTWLSSRAGETYRLPTEAEWEYAARAETTTRYHWGDRAADACDYANVGTNYNGGCTERFDRYAPVGSLRPNAYGLYDMSGNVWEWVEGCWHGNYDGAPSSGSAWASECSGTARVLRGGSWIDTSSRYFRSADRYGFEPDSRVDVIGFRVARALPR